MDTLTLAMQNLKVAEMLHFNRSPNRDDQARLTGLIEFLDRILAAHSYYSSGTTEGLEESAFDEYRYACRTVEALHRGASTSPDIKKSFQSVRRDIVDLLEKGTLNAQHSDMLRLFLETVGRAVLAEDLSSSPVLEGIEQEALEEANSH